jgi:uncharacterized protein (DUF952 family)
MIKSNEKFIYHLVIENEFKANYNNDVYLPSNYQEDGFIHCSSKDSVIPVATDYFSNIKDLILLKIDISLLKSEVKFETPAPLKSSNNTHIKDGLLCPHVYGSINRQSIIGVAKMVNKNSRFEFPKEFVDLNIIL